MKRSNFFINFLMWPVVICATDFLPDIQQQPQTETVLTSFIRNEVDTRKDVVADEHKERDRIESILVASLAIIKNKKFIAEMILQDNKKPINRSGAFLYYRTLEGDVRILLGKFHDNTWMPFAGGVDGQIVSVAAARELEEETGGLVKLSPDKVLQHTILYDNSYLSKILFMVPLPDEHTTEQVRKACCDAMKNPKLSGCYKEVHDIAEVSLSVLIHAAEAHSLKTVKSCQVPSLKHGTIPFNGHYIGVISNNIDRLKSLFSLDVNGCSA